MAAESNLKVSPGSALAIGVAVVGGALAWGDLAHKVSQVAEDIEQIRAEKVDRQCLAIVHRQTLARDKDREDVINALASLAEQQGCFATPAEAYAAATGSADAVGYSWAIEDAATAIEADVAVWKTLEKVDAQLAQDSKTK